MASIGSCVPLVVADTWLAVVSEVEAEDVKIQAAERFPDCLDVRELHDVDGKVSETEKPVSLAVVERGSKGFKQFLTARMANAFSLYKKGWASW